MKKRTLGPDGPEVSAIGLGCMGMSAFYGATDEAEALRTIARALDLGCNFLDTSDMYGPHTNEELARRARIAGRRDEVFLATKFGIRIEPGEDGAPWRRVDRRQPRVRAQLPARPRCSACRSTTSTSTTSTASTPGRRSRRPSARWPSSSPRARSATSASPRPSAETIRRAHAVHPITAVQTEYSLWTRDVEEEILPTLEELGHRARRLLAARPRLPLRALHLARGARRGRLPPLRPALHRREPRAQPRCSPSASRSSRRRRASRPASSRSPGSCTAASTSCRSPAPSASPTSSRTSPPPTSMLSDEDVQRITEAVPAAAGERYDPEGMRTVNI